MKKKQKIFVGISGGVDSSVAAYLLKRDGYEVHGIFVKTWSPEWLPCTWIDEKRDAMRVCAALDIPLHFLDAETVYKQGVADYMIAEYRAGRTPNPDVLCNKVIKFGVMWDYAQAHGADMIATGHYAQVDDGVLKKGSDEAKDQSYFLWMVPSEILAYTLFPIGHLQKSEVRSIAERAGLFTSSKKDSQGICFLGDVDMREFLSHYIEQKIGEVVDEDGEVIGSHDGVRFYTLGERHGFHIEGPTDRPYYIVGKDIERNRIIVSHTVKTSTKKGTKIRVTLREPNWTKTFDTKKKYVAQIRYHGELIDAKVVNDHEVILSHNGVIALGQSLVIYDGAELIGGGIIDQIS